MPRIPDEILLMSTKELKDSIDKYGREYGLDFIQFMESTQQAWISKIWEITGFLFWLSPSTPDPCGQVTMNNGSTFVVQTLTGCFGVTAGHVYDSYLIAQQRDPKVRCHFGRNTHVIFDLKDRLISRGKDIDIATFFVKSKELSQISLLPVKQWPPLIPERDYLIALGGYPGAERSYDPRNKLDFGLLAHIGIISDVHDTRLTCSLEFGRCAGLVPPPGYPTGGMSGGPVMAILNYWDPETW
jgi:hypothetical protein